MNNIILTSYFTGKPDPQRTIHVRPNNPEYIQRWCDSIAKIGLRGLVFYNELFTDFIKSYESDHIGFIKVALGKYSTNDERFLHWHKYLESHIGDYDHALMTDISDVVFVRNPFDFMKLTNFPLYFGREQRIIGDNLTMTRAMTQFYGGVLYSDREVLNAGTIGGKIEWVLKFLEYMKIEIGRIGSLGNCNMSALNYTAYSKFRRSDFFAGRPFTSAFKAFENPAVTECYIVHK